MQVIEGHKIAYMDVDSTMIMWDVSKYSDLPMLDVQVGKETATVAVNQKNINFARRLHKQGFVIVVWSHAGWQWAKAVVEALELDWVTLVISKPSIYIDDTEAKDFMTERFYRLPNATNSERGRDETGIDK